MKPRLTLLGVLTVLLVALAGCGTQSAPSSGAAPSGGSTAAKQDITIGVEAPMTGTYAEYGQIWKKSFDIALDEINSKGVIPGKNLKLDIQDSQSDPKQAATIAKKFADDPNIPAIIGDFSSSASLAAAPIYLSAKKPELSPTASDPKFTQQGEYMFSIVGSQNAEAPFLANMATKDLSSKKIAVMYINNDWGQVTKQIFEDTAKQSGASITQEQSFLDQDNDFRATLTRLQATNPDLLFVAGFYAQVSLLQKQRVDLGWKVPVLTPSSCYSPELIKQGGSAVDGQMLAAVFFPSDPNPKVSAFVKTFKDKYNQEPNQFAALAYDSVYLLAETIAKTGTDPVKIRDGLANDVSGYVGVTGPMKFDTNRVVQKNYVPLVVKNNDFQVWKQQ